MSEPRSSNVCGVDAMTQPVLEASGVQVHRIDAAGEVAPTVAAAARLAYQTGRSVAVLIGQRVIGSKNFNK